MLYADTMMCDALMGMGVDAPTCSSLSKPPAIAGHVLAETARPASRQLVQGMSVVNESRSSLPTFTKTGAQQVTCSFHILESGSCTEIRDAQIKHLF